MVAVKIPKRETSANASLPFFYTLFINEVLEFLINSQSIIGDNKFYIQNSISIRKLDIYLSYISWREIVERRNSFRPNIVFRSI